MFVQIISLEVKPGTRETLIEALRFNCAGSRQEPGNIRFDLLCDPENENRFLVYEVFESEAALERHRSMPHYQACGAMLDPIVVRRSKQILQATDVEAGGRSA